jgi:hypothetical protein
MDKRLICGLFGHFLIGGNSGIWAEIGVSVHYGRGFCREGWETLKERDETGKHLERNLPAVIKVLVKFQHEWAARWVLLQSHGVKHHCGNRRTQLKHYDAAQGHRTGEQYDNDMMAHDNIDRGLVVPFRLMHCLLHTREDLRNSYAAKDDSL